jgi:hypothetical protein
MAAVVAVATCQKPWFLGMRSGDVREGPGQVIFFMLQTVFVAQKFLKNGSQMAFPVCASKTGITLRKCASSAVLWHL